MSHSHHAKSPRQRRREQFLERDDAGNPPVELLKLEEQSLKKDGAKETEQWRRDAAKAGGLHHRKFTFTDGGWDFRRQKMRGVLSDVPGEVIAPETARRGQVLMFNVVGDVGVAYRASRSCHGGQTKDLAS